MTGVRPPCTIGFVLPVFNEGDGVEEFHRRLTLALEDSGDLRFRFVYVDDGSTDQSVVRLRAMQALDPRMAIVVLSRNFGHQIAVTAGLERVGEADAVIVMDTDLQDPPEVAVQMIARWRAGAEVVNAQRRSRQDGPFKRLTAFVFYWLLSRAASIEIPRNVGDFRLMDAAVVRELLRYREHSRFLRGMVAHVGFRQEILAFDRDERYAGQSGYPLRAMVRLAADGVLGFSVLPLKLIARIGVLMSILSLVGIGYVVARRFLQPDEIVPGWAFLSIISFFLSGVQMLMLGVLGSYIGRIYIETQNRPLYSVSRELAATSTQSRTVSEHDHD